MKQRIHPAPTDPIRRTLLLGLPGGLALASPLALVACGGDGAGAEPAPVLLPGGVDPGRVMLVGRAGEARATQADPLGQVSAAELALVSAVHEDGRLVAMGMMKSGAPRALDARSSAETLLFLALGGATLSPADREALQAALQSHAESSALADTIRSLWSTDPFALAGPHPQLAGAVQAAVGRIAATATPARGTDRARALAAVPPMQRIEPSTDVSGVTVLQADDSDGAPGLRIQNTKRRQGLAHVYEVGYTPTDGTPVALALARPQYELIEVPSTQSLSIFSALGDIIAGTAPWSPVETARYGMPMHAGAERTEYELVYLTPVYDRPEPEFFLEVRYSLLRETWREELSRMYQAAQMNFVFGAVLEALGVGGIAVSTSEFNAAIAAIDTSASPGVMELLRRSGMGEAMLPGIRAWLASVGEGSAIVSGAYRVAVSTLVRRANAQLAADIAAANLSQMRLAAFRGAVNVMLGVTVVAGVFDTGAQYRDLHEGQKAHLVNSTLVAPTVTVSPSAGKLGKGKELALTARVGGALRDVTLTSHWTLSGSSLVSLRNAAGATSPSALDSDDLKVTLATTPSTMGTLTIEVEVFAVEGGTRRSLGTAKALIEMSDTVVQLSPASATIERDGGSQAFAASVAAPPVGASELRYEWTCASAYGSVRAGDQATSAASPAFVSALPNVTYAGASGLSGGEIETVSVTAFYTDGEGRRVDIGSASADVTVRSRYSLELLPSLSIVPSDTPITLSAHVREPLPAGSTVDWTWGHTGVGTFAPGGSTVDAGSAVGTLNTGPSEGSALVSVSAIVKTPATASEPAHIVVTPLVALNLSVKKGLTQITFEATGGAFACADPRACGVSMYGAYLVPRLSKAVMYRAVFSGFGYGPCNRSVTWNAPVGDGGGCSFPITYHPHSSAGPTSLWAVWMGFGGPDFKWNPGEGKCVVTITLAP